MARMMIFNTVEAFEIEAEYLLEHGDYIRPDANKVLTIDSKYDPTLYDLFNAVKSGHVRDFIRV